MKKKNSIKEMIELLDSFISKNRSSFLPEEYCVLKSVRLKLLKMQKKSFAEKICQKDTIVQSIITEIIKIIINPDTWNKLKNIF
jgi:hypothetical protein